MRILIWFLNIIQFLIVYLLVFWLLHSGIIGDLGPSGLSGEGLWPAISIGIAAIPWRYYKRFSLFITSKRIKAPTEEVVAEEASNTNEKKELKQKTFFFGYLSNKWKRLSRVLSFTVMPLLCWGFAGLIDFGNWKENFLVGLPIAIVLVNIISYTLKPFVVKED